VIFFLVLAPRRVGDTKNQNIIIINVIIFTITTTTVKTSVTKYNSLKAFKNVNTCQQLFQNVILENQ
jgi:hypothetical protein